MTAQYLRLKESHPTMVKLAKLCEFADELGIQLSYYGMRTLLQDSDMPNITMYVDDIESKDAINEFPFTFEYKITYENQVWLKERQLESEKRAAELKEAEIKRIAAEEQKRIEGEKKAQDKKKQEELKLLADLKAKYE